MWKCKKCGGNRFYQPFKSNFIIIKADKNQDVIESRISDNGIYEKFHCDNCNKQGWTLEEVAKWEEDEEDE